MIHESQMHERNSFVTLTYDKENQPPDGSLKVEDWQRFAKRLRKTLGPFRFYHCGEYGETNGRPHYHAALFGIDFTKDRVLLRVERGTKLYTSPLLRQIWGHGHVTAGQLTYQSAAYVARYVMKKLTGKMAEEYGPLRPPYATMSRRPGIGSTWLEKFHTDVYPSDEVIHNGRKFKPPRYYDEKLTPEQLVRVKNKRKDKAAERAEQLTPEKLKIKEIILEQKLTQLTRKL